MTTQQDIPLPPRPTPRDTAGAFETLPLSLITVSPQVRRTFDEAKLRALADSIHESGVIQPIVVRWVDRLNAYELLAGERRYRAATMVNLATIPAIVRTDLSDDDALALQMVENLQRENLTTDELVHGVGHMVDKMGLAETARRLSINSISTVSRIAGTRTLWAPARKLIEDGKLESVDIAHELAKLASLDEDSARALVQAFYTPRPHNPAPPTRAEIRGVIDIKRKIIETRAADAQLKQQTEIAIDNQRGHSSIAGDARAAPKAPAPASTETPPPESQAGREMAQRVEADNAERQALVTAAQNVANLIALKARIALGYQVDPNPQDESRPFWSIFGRRVDASDIFDDDPLTVSVDNVSLTRFPGDANAIDQARYTLYVEIPHASETELMQLVAGLTKLEAAPPASGLLLRPDEQTVADFISETTVPAEGERLKRDWLYERYRDWCQSDDETPVVETEFDRVMQLLGHELKRFAPGRFYVGLGLNGEEAQ